MQRTAARRGGFLAVAAGVLVAAGLLLVPADGAGAGSLELSAQDREHYKNAFLHANKGNFRDARLHAARAANKLPAKVIQWLDLTRDDSAPSFGEALDFFQSNPDWPRQESLLRSVERAMPWQWPDAEMLAWFEAHPPVSIDGVMKYAGALERSGRGGEAHGLLRRTWREGIFDRVQDQNFYRAHRSVLQKDDHVARLNRMLWSRQAISARRHLRRLGGDYAALAEARIKLWTRKGGVDSALRKVPGRLKRDPGLLYDRALWRQRKGRYDGVVEILRTIGPEQDHASRWWYLRRWAGYEALERGQAQLAYQLARDHGQGKGSGFAEAEWLAGWSAHHFLKDARRAYRHFSRLYYGSTSPISQGRGGYWAAQASARMGKADWTKRWLAASAQHSTSFYGQLAAAQIGQPIDIRFDRHPRPTKAMRHAFEARETVMVARLLDRLGQSKPLGSFLRHLGDRAETPQELALAADLAADLGRPAIGIWAAKRARNRGLLMPELLFPAPVNAKGRGVEPALVLAVTRQESAFDPKAVSPAGARGLMQLMPATARAVAKRQRLPYSKPRLTRDAAYNMKLGTAHLAELLSDYDGSHILTLAAYNAGGSRVSRWIAAHGDPRDPKVDPIAWIEQIPFEETRNYVMRVLESLVIYRKRLGSGLVELPLEPATAEGPGSVQ